MEDKLRLAFLDRHKLTDFSCPHDWFSALLPDAKKSNDSKHTVCLADSTSYINTKVLLANAGADGAIYKDFKPLTVKRIKQFIDLHIFNGLSPSPQIKMKFKPQHEDPVNGKNLCFKIFGKNGEREHKWFKTFFGVQDPKLPIPSKTTHPNFKVDRFLSHIQQISQNAWSLGHSISVDEQTISFKGNHPDKQRISYKREGGGFLYIQYAKMNILTPSFSEICCHQGSTK